MSFNKPNKAAAIRKFMAENPTAKPKDVAVGVGCDLTYVYLVQSADRRKNRPKVKRESVEVTRGQEVLRRELMNSDKTIKTLEEMVQESEARCSKMALEVAHLNVVIKYLERKISGASV